MTSYYQMKRVIELEDDGWVSIGNDELKKNKELTIGGPIKMQKGDRFGKVFADGQFILLDD